MKVDIVVVSKHPVTATRNLWICDGGIPINKVIVETSTPLAKARQRAIRRVSTDWFVFLDDDIILPDDWWALCSQYMWHDSGAVQGTTIPLGLGVLCDEAYERRNQTLPNGQCLDGNSRLYTHNTLIRTDAVRDWNPPADLEAYEDYDLMCHIQRKGYRCFVVKTQTYHLYSWNKFWKNSRWGTRGRLRFRPRSEIVKDFAGTPVVFLKDGPWVGWSNFIRASAAMYEMIVGGKG
jgi:glycosyltransferase involved in cell wall biosynthesis